MTVTQEERVGTYRGRPYFVRIRVTPGFNTPEEFAVVCYYESRMGENVQIARIDTEHGYTHFDRLYRRDEPKEPVEMDFWEAWTRMRNNWRTYAKSHEHQ